MFCLDGIVTTFVLVDWFDLLDTAEDQASTSHLTFSHLEPTQDDVRQSNDFFNRRHKK